MEEGEVSRGGRGRGGGKPHDRGGRDGRGQRGRRGAGFQRGRGGAGYRGGGGGADGQRRDNRPSSGGHGNFRGGRGDWRGGNRARGDRRENSDNAESSKRSKVDDEDEVNPQGKDADKEDDQQFGEEVLEEEDEPSPLEEESKRFFTPEMLGMTEFIAPQGLGLQGGKLKVVPEDFHVNEIGEDGVVVRLKKHLAELKESKNIDDVPSNSAAAPQEQFSGLVAPTTASQEQSNDDEVSQRISAFKSDLGLKMISLTERDDLALKELMRSGPPGREKSVHVVFENPVSDKALRGYFHQTIRKHLAPFVTSTTTDDQKIKLDRASAELLRKDQRRFKAGEIQAETGKKRPLHVELVLRKRNVETNHCLSELARMLRIPRKNFGMSGTKDKRAVTTQRISIRFCTVKDLIERSPSTVKISFGEEQYFELGDPVETEETKFLGGLKGNHFTIVVRDFAGSVDVGPWESVGFINYFGEQRFGTNEVGTHEVGVALLNRDYVKAIDLLLRPRSGENSRLRGIREKFQRTKDAEALLGELPARCTAERAVVSGLAQGLDPLACLLLIPRNALTMYLHAVQSLLWNKAVSLRVKGHGIATPVKGDLVRDKKNDNKVIRIVSDEEAMTFSIHDVVLSMPGADTIYPGTDAVNAGILDDLLKEMGVECGLEQLEATEPKELALAGSYRNIVARPENVRSRILKYDQDDQVLLKEDGQFPSETEFMQGDKQAFLVSFALSSGMYATMAIRELMHASVA